MGWVLAETRAVGTIEMDIHIYKLEQEASLHRRVAFYQRDNKQNNGENFPHE